METEKGMSVDVEKVITDKAEETRKTFRALLDKISVTCLIYRRL